MGGAKRNLTYPVFLDLTHRLVLIVGGGNVGQRKLAGLLQSGARVRLVDPQVVKGDFPDPAVQVVAREYRHDDLDGVFLAFACTGSPQVNAQLLSDARQCGVLCCSAQGTGGDFVLPAKVQRGALCLAVSTNGRSPALAAVIRDQLAAQMTASWGFGLEIVAAVRQNWLTDPAATKYNQQVLRSFWLELLQLLDSGDYAAVDRLLRETFGDQYTLESLHIQRPEGQS